MIHCDRFSQGLQYQLTAHQMSLKYFSNLIRIHILPGLVVNVRSRSLLIMVITIINLFIANHDYNRFFCQAIKSLVFKY